MKIRPIAQLVEYDTDNGGGDGSNPTTAMRYGWSSRLVTAPVSKIGEPKWSWGFDSLTIRL